MKRAVAWIDGVRFGKHDLPPSRATYGMFSNLPEGEGRWETEADRAMAEALAEAGDAARCRLRVHVDGFDAEFSRWAHFKYLLWVFGQLNMPRGYRLTGREEPGTADNRHWLSRLPAEMKSWSFRRQVMGFLTGPDAIVQRYIAWHLSRGATPPPQPA